MADANLPSSPSPDQCAAHEFLAELRTRIVTQRLPYQSGIEARALESLWELFAQAREIMKKYPGCATFSDAVTRTLNIAVRSVTVKWDRAHADGRLNSRDGADQFREDFAELQSNLCDFAAQMHEMAYGFNFADEQTPPLIPQDFLKKCFEDVEFGIPNDGLSIKQKEIIAEINVVEAAEIKMRRAALNADSLDSNKNAVGLALSGGGIRSAIFSLGVVQVLAARNILQNVDLLSTVSGGGYTGTFLSTRLGCGEPFAALACPSGPDPAPIAYLRQRIKFLPALISVQGVTTMMATIAGLLVNWTAPLFFLALSALAAVVFTDWFPYDVWSVLSGTVAAGLLPSAVFYIYQIKTDGHYRRLAGSSLSVFLWIILILEPLAKL